MADTARIAELRSALETKTDTIRRGASQAIQIDGENVEIKSADYNDLKRNIAEAEDIRMAIKAELGDPETEALYRTLETPEQKSAAIAAAAAGAFGLMADEYKSLGERFTESDEFKQMLKSGGANMHQPFEVQEKDVASLGYGQKDVFTSSVPGTTSLGFGRRQFDPMVQRPQRPLRVRDLFPVSATSANLIDFFRVLGFLENGGAGAARPVAERRAANGTGAPTGEATDVFGLKPRSTLRFESAQAPVRTIAHWEAAHRNVLADEPQLQSVINNELLYGLSLAEDEQILNGDGTGENLLGILNTPGIQEYTQDAGDQYSDALRRAATLSVIANYPGTGFVLHPFDWEKIELQKTVSGGDGQYMVTSNVTIGATTQIWRQPVVETPAMPEGQFLTGAFGLAAQLYDRMQANVRVAEQHADFFVRNAIVVLAEERLALAVKRPESFVHGSFTGDNRPASSQG